MPPPTVPLDAIRRPAVLYDAGGRLVATNEMADALADRPLAGLTAAELAGIFDVRTPDGAPLADAAPILSRALAGEEVVDLPLVVTLPDGRTLEILATAAPVREGDAITGALVVWQDVTACVAAERALREGEEKHRALLDASPDIVLLLDAEGTVLSVSKTCASLLGRPAAELVGASIWAAMPPEVAGYRRERFDEVLRSGHPSRFEERRGDRWYDTMVEPVPSGAGEVSRIAVISRNITDRKAVETALRESEERLRSILDRSLDALYRRNLLTERYEYYSPAIEPMVGFSMQEVLAMSQEDVLERLHPDDRARAIAAKLEISASVTQNTVDYRFRCKDGTYRWVSDRFRITCDSAGRPVAREGIIRDITERMLAEEALRESEEKYRALIETNVDFVWEMDLEGRFTYCSPQIERLWGIRPEEMVGRAPFDLMPPDEREAALAAFVEMVRAPGGFSGLETPWYDSRGNRVALEISGVPFFGDDGVLLGFRGVTRDVTERVRAREALQESEADARAFFENMVDACAICEVVLDGRGEPADLRLVDVNPAFERTLCLPGRLIVGQTAFMILPTLHREWLDLFLEVSRNRTFVAVEEPFPALDRRYHVTGFPVRNGRVAVVFRDVTGDRPS